MQCLAIVNKTQRGTFECRRQVDSPEGFPVGEEILHLQEINAEKTLKIQSLRH